MIGRKPTDKLKSDLDQHIQWAQLRQNRFNKLAERFNNSIADRAELTRLNQAWENACKKIRDYCNQHSFALGSYRQEDVRKCLADQENTISIMQALFTLPQITSSIATKQPTKKSTDFDIENTNYRLKALSEPAHVSLLSDLDPDLKNPEKDCCDSLPSLLTLGRKAAVNFDRVKNALSASLDTFFSSSKYAEVQEEEHYHILQETASTRQKIT